MRERGHLFVPIVIVFVGLVAGYSAPLCALVGTLACLPMALMRKITRAGHHLEIGARSARGRREEHALGGHGLRLRRHRDRLRDHSPAWASASPSSWWRWRRTCCRWR